MNSNHYYLNNKTDMYVYFESIEQLMPSTVLDIGMFLKRIGTISAQALDQSVPISCVLDGVDFSPEKKLPVYRTIYRHIQSYDAFFTGITSDNEKSMQNAAYDLASLLYIDRLLSSPELQNIWEWVSTHCKYAVANYNPEAYLYFNGCKAYNDFRIDTESYSIITFR